MYKRRLLGYAIRQRDPATLRGLERLRNIALLFVVANILASMTLEQSTWRPTSAA